MNKDLNAITCYVAIMTSCIFIIAMCAIAVAIAMTS